MEEEENKEEQTTTTTPVNEAKDEMTGTVQKDTSKTNMDTKIGNNVDYQSGAVKTGQKGAENLKGVTVPKYTPISYKMLKNDPEVKGAIPSLIGNAVFKGLEGALSTKASGRQFDPTTRMSEYNDAEMARYKENATDKENAIYQAQKQPIENAISAEAQAGIQKEDAALNAYIQDYTAEKDQDRKMAILHQVMGQAGLVQKDRNGNIITDENGNPVFKDWTELEVSDLLKLNQLMQYLSGDTSVMNLLVGQYGPEIAEKIERFTGEIEAQGGLGNWLRNLITGQSSATPETKLTPEYSMDDLKAALEQDDQNAILYKNSRVVDLGNGYMYDISDEEGKGEFAKQLANYAMTTGQSITPFLDEYQKKVQDALNKGWFNSGKKDAKAARADIETLYDTFINKATGGVDGNGNPLPPPVDTTAIDDLIQKLSKDQSKTETKVDYESLKTQIENSGLPQEQKDERLKQVDEYVTKIKYNKHLEDVKNKVSYINKNIKIPKEKSTGKNFAKKGTYKEALTEAGAIHDVLKQTGEPLEVIKDTDLAARLLEIAQTATGEGRLKAEDDKNGGLLQKYLVWLGDPKYWE